MTAHLVLIGTLVITAYRPIPAQTKPECKNRYYCETSIGENVSELGCAVSQDLLRSGKIHYRDVLLIPDVGFRIVNDTMASRIRNHVDVFVYSRNEEKEIGVRRQPVYIVKLEEGK